MLFVALTDEQLKLLKKKKVKSVLSDSEYESFESLDAKINYGIWSKLKPEQKQKQKQKLWTTPSMKQPTDTQQSLTDIQDTSTEFSLPESLPAFLRVFSEKDTETVTETELWKDTPSEFKKQLVDLYTDLLTEAKQEWTQESAALWQVQSRENVKKLIFNDPDWQNLFQAVGQFVHFHTYHKYPEQDIPLDDDSLTRTLDGLKRIIESEQEAEQLGKLLQLQLEEQFQPFREIVGGDVIIGPPS